MHFTRSSKTALLFKFQLSKGSLERFETLQKCPCFADWPSKKLRPRNWVLEERSRCGSPEFGEAGGCGRLGAGGGCPGGLLGSVWGLGWGRGRAGEGSQRRSRATAAWSSTPMVRRRGRDNKRVGEVKGVLWEGFEWFGSCDCKWKVEPTGGAPMAGGGQLREEERLGTHECRLVDFYRWAQACFVVKGSRNLAVVRRRALAGARTGNNPVVVGV
jgi:hypothetical protein